MRSLGAYNLLHTSNFNIFDYFSDDISVLQSRSIVFGDLLRVSGLYELLQSITKKLVNFSEILHSKTEVGDKERSIFSAKQLQTYFEIIEEMDAYNKSHNGINIFSSDKFKNLFEQVRIIKNSEEYINLKKGTNKLIDEITHIKSVSVGFNFDGRLSPVEMGVLSLNDKYIESGKLIDKILRFDFLEDNLTALGPIVAVDKALPKSEFDLLQDSLCRAVDKIFTRALRSWPGDFENYIERQLKFLLDLKSDFQFMLIVTDIHRKIIAAGIPLSVPNYYPKNKHIFTAEQLYNPLLAVSMKERGDIVKIVGNDFRFDDSGKVYILTGPNNGGKTVFTVSVGLAQVFSQLGMLVPAKKLDISPIDHIYVHFPKYLSNTQMGRLEDECARVKEIFESINEFSLCLFDETFSSTDFEEGEILAFEVLRSIESYGAYSIFGTHFHHLVSMIYDEKGIAGKHNGIDFLCAGISKCKSRTYRIERSKHAGKSYASDIAEKYGLSYQSLAHKKCDLIND